MVAIPVIGGLLPGKGLPRVELWIPLICVEEGGGGMWTEVTQASAVPGPNPKAVM